MINNYSNFIYENIIKNYSESKLIIGNETYNIRIYHKNDEIIIFNKETRRNDIVFLGKGSTVYLFNNEIHRNIGPAIIDPTNNSIEFWTNGKRHRTDGPAVINNKTGYKIWYNNGILHRDNGPTVINEKEGVEIWYTNGKLNRMNGPSIVNKIGNFYFIKGKRYEESKYWNEIKEILKNKS